jgi:hypothetical protein
MFVSSRVRVAAVLAATAAVALATTPAFADNVQATITGGALSVTTAGATLSGVTLNGTSQVASGDASAPWSISDNRGSGAGWTVAVTATTPTSIAGSSDLVARTLPVANLSMSTGTIVAGTGSDAITNITGATDLPMSVTAQTLVSSSGTNKGSYALTPSFELAVPANAYRSNFVGAVGSTAVIPYVSTLTYTIA